MKKFFLLLLCSLYLASASPNIIDDITREISHAQDIYDIEKTLSNSFNKIVSKCYLQSWTKEEDVEIKTSLIKLKDMIQKKASKSGEPWGKTLVSALSPYEKKDPERLANPNWTRALTICEHLKEIELVMQPFCILRKKRVAVINFQQAITENMNKELKSLCKQYAWLKKSHQNPTLIDRELLAYATNRKVHKTAPFIKPIQDGHYYKISGFVDLKREIAQKIIDCMQHLKNLDLEALINTAELNNNAQTDDDCNVVISNLRLLLTHRSLDPELPLNNQGVNMIISSLKNLTSPDKNGHTNMYFIAQNISSKDFMNHLIEISTHFNSSILKKAIFAVADTNTGDSFLHVCIKILKQNVGKYTSIEYKQNLDKLAEVFDWYKPKLIASTKNFAGESPIDILPKI